MADTQIDELRLDITVEDKTSGESSDKKVKNLATAISRLNKNLQAFDNAKFTKVFDNMSKGLDPFVKKIEKVSNALASLAMIVSKSGLDKAAKEVTGKVPELKTETYSDSGRQSEPAQAEQGQAEELQETTNEAKSLGSSILNITNKADILRKKLEMINAEMQKSGLSEKQLVQLKSQQLSIQEQIAKAEGKKPKVPLSNLLKSFGRIAMYRAVRRTIQEITQAFMESIDGIARYNSEFRDTMGSLQSSMAKAKASMGVAFYQVLILLEPLITQIANGIANLANSLAKVTANMRGVATYTKINTEYMKEYQSATQGTLLAFDTFTTLSAGQGIDYSKMFETGEDALDENKFSATEQVLQGIFSIVGAIIELIKTLTPIIEPFISAIINLANVMLPVIIDDIKKIMPILKPIVNVVVNALNAIMHLINAITKFIKGDFKGAFESLGEVFKTIGNLFASIFEAIINGIITAINILLKPINWIGQAFGAGENFAQIPNVSLGRFKDGGMFEGAGTMYALAGESGAEVVATGSAGTGVLNVDQFADAMVSALVRYGAARDTSNGTTIVLDGNKVGQLVASNVGFRNEANRRNAGLNWK